MTELETVRYTVNGGLARIQLNRPRYRNAQSAKLLEETDEAFNLAAGDPDVKVIILSGLGEAFSSGHDLGTPERQAELAQNRTDISEIENLFVYSYSHFLEMSLRWRDLPKPTIAQVHGWCILGGWIVASAMDLIIAAEDARFVISHLQYSSLLFELGARKARKSCSIRGRFRRGSAGPRCDQLRCASRSAGKGDHRTRNPHCRPVSLLATHGEELRKRGGGRLGFQDGNDGVACELHAFSVSRA